MILNLPSPCQMFEVGVLVPKDVPVSFAHYIATEMVFTAPIPLKPKDRILVDLRNGHVEVVEREGIKIWRSGWEN